MATDLGLKITADIKQVLQLSSWINQLEDAVYDPEPMVRAVRIMGIALQNNFKGEGSYGNRKWQSLTQMTQDVREERGHPRAHPILVQTGRLRFMSADVFAGWRMGAMSYMPSDNKGSIMVANISRGHFSAQLTGPKSLNHSGGMMSDVDTQREFYLPARPFFYIPGKAVPDMTIAYADGVMINWIGRSGSPRAAKRVGGGMFSVADNAKSSRGKVAI